MHGNMSILTTKHITGHIGDDFYGSDDPTNSVKALKDNSWVSPPGKEPIQPDQALYKVK